MMRSCKFTPIVVNLTCLEANKLSLKYASISCLTTLIESEKKYYRSNFLMEIKSYKCCILFSVHFAEFIWINFILGKILDFLSNAFSVTYICNISVSYLILFGCVICLLTFLDAGRRKTRHTIVTKIRFSI